MAEAEKEKEPEVEIKPSGGKKKLIIIILAALLLLGGGGGAAFFFLAGGDEKKAEDGHGAKADEHGAKADEHAAEEDHGDKTPEEIAAEKEAFYIKLPRAFMFNAHGQTRDRLVQIKVTLLVRGPANEALAKQHAPLAEGALLKVFSSASVEQITTIEGKQKLKKDALSAVQSALKEITGGKTVVERVLFTGFVMQ